MNRKTRYSRFDTTVDGKLVIGVQIQRKDESPVLCTIDQLDRFATPEEAAEIRAALRA